MICCQYSSRSICASAAIFSVPNSASVQLKRPAFSFSPRQSSIGRIASPRRMISDGSTPSSACGLLSASTVIWWSISSTTPRR